MKVEKIIFTTEPVELKVEEVTLLSTDEYSVFREMIPIIRGWWWLRSLFDYCVGAVYGGGAVDYFDVSGDLDFGVRPVLRISNLKSSNLNVGDKVKVAGYIWTVISDEYMLCDEVVNTMVFREDWRVLDANVYEKSDIKKWLDDWAKENGLLD